MNTTDKYLTIDTPSEGIYKEKGSRFLAFAYPVFQTEEIKELIAQAEKKYHDARHCCYAWKLGQTDDNYRFNDDGEPSGTAGKPIYGQILSNNLTNILIIVVRYFGGIKLGTSGLIVAYKTATADAIANANIVERYVQLTFEVGFPYAAMNDVMKVLKDTAVEVLSQQFDLSCYCKVRMRQSLAPDFQKRMTDIEGVELRAE